MKLSLFADDMIVYIEDPLVSTKVINEHSKVVGYKINIQKSIAFLCLNNRQTELVLKKVVSFTIATKSVRYYLKTQPRGFCKIAILGKQKSRLPTDNPASSTQKSHGRKTPSRPPVSVPVSLSLPLSRSLSPLFFFFF